MKYIISRYVKQANSFLFLTHNSSMGYHKIERELDTEAGYGKHTLSYDALIVYQ